MVKGRLDDFNIENSGLSAEIKLALWFLKDADLASLSREPKPIVVGESFIFLTEYQTQNPAEKKAEAHKRTVDIQYLISGQEKIGLAPAYLDNQAATDYNAQDDYTLYDSVRDEEFFPLQTGEFMVIMPGEVRRPGCNFAQEAPIKKAIIKIDLSSIK